jgi:hypothetical protein
MSQAIAAGEIEVTSTYLGKWLWREELMAKALELWPPDVIEEALDADTDGVLPEAVRLIDLHVRLPRHHVAMLAALAERDRSSVSSVLARELDGASPARMRPSSPGRWSASRTRWRGPMPTPRNRPADPSVVEADVHHAAL